MKKLRTLFIVLILFSSLFLNIQVAKADGSTDAMPVWVEYHKTNLEPWNSTGTYNDGLLNLRDTIRLSYIVFPSDVGNDKINITRVGWRGIQEYVSDTDYTVMIYEVEDVDDATNLRVFYAFLVDYTINGWNYVTLPAEWELNGDFEVYLGVWCELQSGAHQIYFENVAQDYGSLEHDVGPGLYAEPPPDPLVGELRNSTIVYAFRADYDHWGNTTTSYNQYYGNESVYVTRRDYSYTFPSSSSNREVRTLYPRVEHLVNISYYSGGTYNQQLTSNQYTDEIYNGTHNLITIPEETISSKGSNFRFYTSSSDYVYTLYGLYFENGTRAGSVEVTASREGGSNDYTVNGTMLLGFEDPVIQFSWSIEGGGMHYIHPVSDIETFYITTPDDTYSSYSFTIKDYSGAIGSQDSYLESLRMINGTERLIERMMIWDTTNSVPLTLTISKSYALQVRTPKGVVRFPYFIPGGNTAPTLTISGMDFSDQVHYVGEHIAVEVTRVNATHIQIDYNDTLLQTTSVFVEAIETSTGTQIWNDTSSEDAIQFNWYGATNTTDYLVKLEAYHEFYGKITYSKALQGAQEDLDVLPDFDSFLGPGATNGFSILVIFIAVFGFSRTSALFGVFIGVATAYALTFIGLLDVPYLPIHAALTLTILWGLSGGGQR